MNIPLGSFTATNKKYISTFGRHQVHEALVDYLDSVVGSHHCRSDAGYSVDIVDLVMRMTGPAWIVDKKVDNVCTDYWAKYSLSCENEDDSCVSGTFPKRVKKILNKYFNIKLPDDFVSVIGEIARRSISSNETIYLEIVNRIYWQDGDFGDGGSCYWGGRSYAKTMIVDSGGGAVLHWADEEHYDGRSRCWFIPYKDGLVLFNAYGDLRLEHFADYVSKHLGLTYNFDSHLMNNDDDTSTLYINNGGFYLHPEGTPDETHIDFEIPDNSYSCHECNDRYDEDDMTTVHGGYMVCQSCLEYYYSYCDHCGEYYLSDDVVYVDGNNYCESCQRDLDIHECDKCGEYHKDCTDINSSTYRYTWVCPDCLEDYQECTTCNEWKKIEDMKEDPAGDYLCEECFHDQYVICDECGQIIRVQFSTTINGRDLCNDCSIEEFEPALGD